MIQPETLGSKPPFHASTYTPGNLVEGGTVIIAGVIETDGQSLATVLGKADPVLARKVPKPLQLGVTRLKIGRYPGRLD